MNRAHLATLLLPFLLLGCPKKDPSGGDAGAADGMAGDGGGGAEAGAGGDDVQPVYPIEPNAPAIPLAQKLCEGLSEMPEKKRAACCTTTMGVVVTSECTRMLSAALRYKAVVIAEADVDKCIAAYEKALDGCDWVGPFPPNLPTECQSIVKGLLPENTKCRSSLECPLGMRCRGVGPTTGGKCAPPKLPGEICGGTVDSLATFVRQNDLDKQHPDCSTGHCIKHRCAIAVGDNGPCQVTADCLEGLQCLPTHAPHAVKISPKSSASAPPPQRTCVKHSLPKEGEACPAGICPPNLQCISNKCSTRKNGGEECTNDFECRGGCIRPAGSAAKGKCGPRCDIR